MTDSVVPDQTGWLRTYENERHGRILGGQLEGQWKAFLKANKALVGGQREKITGQTYA